MTGKYMKQKGIIEKVVSVNKSCVGIKLFGYGTYYVNISSIKKWRGSKSNGQKFYYNIQSGQAFTFSGFEAWDIIDFEFIPELYFFEEGKPQLCKDAFERLF